MIESKEFIVFGIRMVIYGKKPNIEMTNVMDTIKYGLIKVNYLLKIIIIKVKNYESFYMIYKYIVSINPKLKF